MRRETLEKLRAGLPLENETPDGDMTLVEASAKFIMGMQSSRAKASLSSYNWAREQLLKYFDEKTLLSSITQVKMYEYVSHRQNIDGVGPSKLSQELSFIKMVYETARSWDIDIPSPERNIPRPKKNRPSREDKLDRVIKELEMVPFLEKVKAGHVHQYITPEKYEKKFGSRNEILHLYLLFLLYTGMRPTEAAKLRWDKPTAKQLKQLNKRMTHLGYVDLSRGGFSKVGTKTETRFVPAHPVAKKIIQYLEKKKTGRFVFLPDEHGQRDAPYKYYRSAFETARENTILKDKSSLRTNIDFYSFRHTARSRMAICGVQDSAAELIIGHEGNEMQRTYTHYDDEGLISEIKKLDYPWLKLEK